MVNRHVRPAPKGMIAAAVLGVDEALLPRDFSAASRTAESIADRDRIANILGIEPASPARAPLAFSGKVGDLVRSSAQALALQLAPLVGRRLLDAIVSVKLGTKEVAFSMPGGS
jgi:hypothetical protein